MAPNKAARHELLRKFLEKGPIRNQEEIRQLLIQEGVEVNQATISRDIREMGLMKTPDGYLLPELAALRRNRPVGKISLGMILSIQEAANMVVVKTPPGLAPPTGIALDRLGLEEILGTVSGDDTVFIATPNEQTAKKLCERLEKESAL